MNYTQDIPYLDTEHIYNAVIEISNGDGIKYEVCASGEYLTVNRALSPMFRYPFNYGYIPQTLADDGDGIDVVVVTPEPLARLSVVKVKILGYLSFVDGNKVDNKILAVPAYSNVRRLPIEKIKAFFQNYKYPDRSSIVGDLVTSISEGEALVELAHDAYCQRLFSGEQLEEEVIEDAEPIPDFLSLQKGAAVVDACSILPLSDNTGSMNTDLLNTCESPQEDSKISEDSQWLS